MQNKSRALTPSLSQRERGDKKFKAVAIDKKT